MTDARLVGMTAGILPAAHFHRWRKSPMLEPVMVYGACFLPALLMTRSWAWSLFGYPGIYSGSALTFLLCAAGLLLGEQLEEGRETVKKMILAAGSATVVVSVAQHLGVDVFNFGAIEGLRAPGFVGSAVDTGALFVVLLAYAPSYLIPPFLAGVWAAASRGSWLGAAVSLTPRRFQLWAFAAAVVIGTLGVYRSSDESNHGRRAIWGVAAHHLSFFGTGPSTFALTFRENWNPAAYVGEALNPAHAHNEVLEAATTRGLFGLLGLIAFFAVPELAGLWTVCMFNPVSFEVVFIACVLAGLSRGTLPETKENRHE